MAKQKKASKKTAKPTKTQKSKKITKSKQKQSSQQDVASTSTPSLQQSVEKKIEKKPKKATTADVLEGTSYKGYNTDQLKQFKALKNDLDNYAVKELQDMLALNNQTKTGVKKDLIEKIADGIVLGQIPRCPHCFGGRLKFNYKTGVYNCPGFQDDDHFRFCNKKFQLGEIQRSPWNNSLFTKYNDT